MLSLNAMPWYGSHTYLNEYITQNACRLILEIGVYNGDNAVSMVEAALKKSTPDKITYYGFDYFNYYKVEQVGKKIEALGCNVRLFKGDTSETLPKALGTLPQMDIIFIDAGKTYNAAKSDWVNSSKLMHSNTGAFIHNADYSGVSRVIEEIKPNRFNLKLFHETGEGTVALIKKKPSDKHR